MAQKERNYRHLELLDPASHTLHNGCKLVIEGQKTWRCGNHTQGVADPSGSMEEYEGMREEVGYRDASASMNKETFMVYQQEL